VLWADDGGDATSAGLARRLGVARIDAPGMAAMIDALRIATAR
jgi:hypothetical protein